MQFWTESFVQWSPLGTYLATIHRQGAAVWGGEKSFNRLMRYIHPQVKFCSPLSTFYSSHLYSLKVAVNVMTFELRVSYEMQGSLKSCRGIFIATEMNAHER